MDTLVLEPDAAGIRLAAEALRRGSLVAYPTDTVYGLGAHLFLPDAVERIYRVKGRVEHKPIAVLLADVNDLDVVAKTVPPAARKLGERFWPGALTLVLPSVAEVPEVVRAGGMTIGVRIPNHPTARALIRETGTPLATTSANRSGERSPTSAAEVLAQLGGRLEYLVRGECPGGIESTVVDLTGDTPVILRQGAISREAIMRAIQ